MQRCSTRSHARTMRRFVVHNGAIRRVGASCDAGKYLHRCISTPLAWGVTALHSVPLRTQTRALSRHLLVAGGDVYALRLAIFQLLKHPPKNAPGWRQSTTNQTSICSKCYGLNCDGLDAVHYMSFRECGFAPYVNVQQRESWMIGGGVCNVLFWFFAPSQSRRRMLHGDCFI